MSLLRRCLLALLLLIPLATLFHRDDLGHFTAQYSAMAGPDEFSYLLMADNFLHHGGLSLQSKLGFDTFYPPGYPLLMAGWTALFFHGHLTAFAAHALNAALLSADIFLAYFLTRQLFRAHGTATDHRRDRIGPNTADWLALLVTALFAVNWHLLECALLVMSEPAFMLVVFGWLLVSLRWPLWHLHVGQTALVALLATLAWSIRGAGITCVAATVLYPILRAIVERESDVPPEFPRDVHAARRRRLAPIAVILAVAILYQAAIALGSPEKSLLAGKENHNSYPQQLLFGLTNGHTLRFANAKDYPDLFLNLFKLVGSHLNDFANSFIPWPRENPDMHFRDLIGKIMAATALLGWCWSALRPLLKNFQPRATQGLKAFPVGTPASALSFSAIKDRKSKIKSAFDLPSENSNPPAAPHFLHLFLILYIALYLIWPFNFTRFWTPILPLMLVYCSLAMVQFTEPRRRVPRVAIAAGVLLLLFILSAQEDILQLPNYARRLNYVSEALANSARIIAKNSPNLAHSAVLTLNPDDAFALDWYFSQLDPPCPLIALAPGTRLPASSRTSRPMTLFPLESIMEAQRQGDGRVFLFAYFDPPDARAVAARFATPPYEAFTPRVIFQKEIIAVVYQFGPPAPRTTAP